MGNNSSIPERIEQNKQFLPDDENNEEGFNSKTDENEEKHEIAADYIFTETENLKSLPPLDHPIKVINNPLFTNPDILKQHKEKLNNDNIQKLETIHDQVINILSDKSDIIIDEYDFNTLISLIITLTENSNILIISPNSHIGQIYEYFNDTSSNIGLITNNLTKTENSNIIDILLLDTIKLDQYHFFIFMIDENIPKLLIEQSLQLISKKKKKQIILYRIFPSHGYADDIIYHVFSDVPKHLNAIQTKSSKCSTNSHINFENCINLTFNSIEEANKLIKTSAYKQGFEISVKDSLKTKENRIRYNCKNKSCPFSIYLKKKHDKIYIKKCDSRHNHDLTP